MNPPIFILSNFRSGSTLLRYLIDAHESVCCPAELRLAATCREIYKVIELTSDDGALDGHERSRDVARATRRVIDEMMQAYCSRRHKERWCDKSPGNTDGLHLIGTIFPDAQFLCLHRRASDQIASHLDMFGHVFISSYLARHQGNEVAAALDHWCTCTERLLAFEHQFPGQATRVLYERLADSAQEEMGRITEFLGLPTDSQLCKRAFEGVHERGPGDSKIGSSTQVEKRGVGRAEIDIVRAPRELRQRLECLLVRVGYEA
jgi:protein-tyrosine sulfotransferase